MCGIAGVARHRGQPVEEQAEDPGGEVVVPHQDVLEVRISRGSVDRAVHAQVPSHQLVAIDVVDVERISPVGEVEQGRPVRPRMHSRLLIRAATGSRLTRIWEMWRRSATSTPVAKVPRRGNETTSRSASSRLSASRTGVRPNLELRGQITLDDGLVGANVEHDQPVPDRQVGAGRQTTSPRSRRHRPPLYREPHGRNSPHA